MSKTKTLRCLLALMLSAALTLGAISMPVAAQDGQGGDIVVGNPTDGPVDPPTDGPIDQPTDGPVDPPAPVVPVAPVVALAQASAMLGGVPPNSGTPITDGNISTSGTYTLVGAGNTVTIDSTAENVTLTGANTSVAITCEAASLTLNGVNAKSLEFKQDATLTIVGTNAISGNNSTGLMAVTTTLTVQESGTGSLTVTVAAGTPSAAISVGSLVLESGTVEATGGDGSDGYGICADGSITVNGNGQLTGNGGGGNGDDGNGGVSSYGGYGVYAGDKVTVINSGTLIGNGGTGGIGGYGVYASGSITVSGGTLTGNGSNGVGGDAGYGIYGNGSITVEGGTLTGTGGTGGVGVGTDSGDIIISSGAVVVATATDSNGIQAGNTTGLGHKVVVSYGGSLTVNGTLNPTNLTYVNIEYLPQPVSPDPEPQPPRPSRRDDDDDSGSGSSGGSASASTVNTSSNVGLGGTVSAGQIQSEASAGLKAATGAGAVIRTQNAAAITPQALEALAKEAQTAGRQLTLHADTVENGAVLGRLYVEPAKLTGRSEDLKLGVYTQLSRTAPVTQRFERYFENTVRVVTLEQQGSFGTALRIAAKVDLTELDTATLHFYSYDAHTNRYIRIDSTAYWIDSNGYLHFYTQLAGSIIITDTPLTLKK